MAFSDNLEAPDAVSGANCASAEQARLYPVRPEIFFRDQQFDGPSRSLRVALDHLFLETLENRNHGYQYVIQNGYRDHRGSVTSNEIIGRHVAVARAEIENAMARFNGIVRHTGSTVSNMLSESPHILQEPRESSQRASLDSVQSWSAGSEVPTQNTPCGETPAGSTYTVGLQTVEATDEQNAGASVPLKASDNQHSQVASTLLNLEANNHAGSGAFEQQYMQNLQAGRKYRKSHEHSAGPSPDDAALGQYQPGDELPPPYVRGQS